MSTNYKGTPEEVLALDTYIKLTRAADSVTQRINQHLGDHQLTISQFGVLESLYHLGPMQLNQLAGKILKSSGNMTLVVDNLEKRGLVERQPDANDRRRQVVHLTANGTALIEAIFPHHVSIVVQEFSVLSADEQQTLSKLCRIVGRRALKTTPRK